jgi:hypothetical protein
VVPVDRRIRYACEARCGIRHVHKYLTTSFPLECCLLPCTCTLPLSLVRSTPPECKKPFAPAAIWSQCAGAEVDPLYAWGNEAVPSGLGHKTSSAIGGVGVGDQHAGGARPRLGAFQIHRTRPHPITHLTVTTHDTARCRLQCFWPACDSTARPHTSTAPPELRALRSA